MTTIASTALALSFVAVTPGPRVLGIPGATGENRMMSFTLQ